MLRIFHNKKVARIMWIGLLIIIGPAFVFWGFGSYEKSQQGEGEFGKVFGKRVSRREYVEALTASQLQMKLQFGEAYDQVLKYVDLKSLALQRIVLLAEARKRRLRVSDQEVVDRIEKDPSFARNGVFNKNLYETAIRYALHISPRTYEEQVRQMIMIGKLSEAVGKGIEVKDDEVRDSYRKEHEQLDLDYASAIPADFTAGLETTDDELKTYFDSHALDFKQPLSFNLDYVELSNEAQVTAINARLEKKQPLERIVKEMGLQIKETGLFTQADAIPGIGWSQEVSAALSDAPVGKVLPALEMEKKFFILRVKERKDPYVPELAQVKDKVKAAVIKERSRGLARQKIDSFELSLNSRASAGDLAKLAGQAGLKSGTTGKFKFGSYLEGIGSSDPFYEKATALREGDYSGVIEMPSGFYIVKLKAKEPIDEKKFEQDKGQAKEALVARKRQEAFGKFIEDLMKKALQ